jgi:purine-binding chemotaxis protein CheW
MIHSYLVFLLSGRLFGVKLLGAIEILPWRRSRSVPLSYSSVEGLIDYRGTIYPVFNIGRRLFLSGPGPTGASAQAEATQSIILLEENKNFFGITVDSVVKMAKLEEPSATPEKIQGMEMNYIQGVVLEDDQEILVLDFERLLHAD